MAGPSWDVKYKEPSQDFLNWLADFAREQQLKAAGRGSDFVPAQGVFQPTQGEAFVERAATMQPAASNDPWQQAIDLQKAKDQMRALYGGGQ